MGRRIPIRLLLVTLAMTAVVPLLVVVTVELVTSYRDARQDARTLAQARAGAVSAELDAHIASIDTVLRSVATLTSFAPEEAEANSRTLRAIKAELPPWFANIILLTPDGRTAGIANGEITPELQAADRPYFQRALAEGGLVSGTPATSRATGEPVIHLARPAPDGAGGVRGVVAISLRLDRLQELIGTSELPDGSVITVIGDNGQVIARSHEAEKWVGQDVRTYPLVQRTLAQQRGTVEMQGIDGRRRLYVFAALEQAPWWLNTGIPIAATFAPIRDEVMRQVALLLAALALAAAGVTLTGRYITLPLARARAAARAFGAGAWSTRAPVAGPTEVQEIATALNLLAENTERQIDELRAGEARVAGIVGSAMDAIITIDQQQCVTLFNRAAEEMFRCPATEAIGRPLDRFLPARVRGLHHQHVEQFGATGVTRRSMGHLEPLTAQRADGVEFPIEATISQIDLDGRRLYTVILRDITDRVRAEEERQRLLERERAAREEAEQAALRLRQLQAVTDAALSSLTLQRLLDELPGRIREALQLDTVTVLLVDPADGALVTRAVVGLDEELDRSLRIPIGSGFAGRVAREQRPVVVEDIAGAGLMQPEFLRAGLCSLLGVPLLAHGQMLGVLHAGSRRERHFTEEDTALLSLAAERMAIALEHARLYEAEQAAHANAQTALRVRDEFLSAVSHELRTPLTSIMGFTQVLERRVERLDGPHRTSLAEGLSTIEVNAQRMTALVTDLLDVSRLQSGRNLQLELEPLELDALVDGIVAEARAAAAGHTFSLSLPDEPLPGVFDRGRLSRAIANIVANAVKYSPGGGEVTVRLARESEPQVALLTVADHGIGIPPDDLPHIFERFHRGGNVGGIWGAGIGLSLVRQIIEQHGGAITVDSALNRGTTVSVHLPLRGALTVAPLAIGDADETEDQDAPPAIR